MNLWKYIQALECNLDLEILPQILPEVKKIVLSNKRAGARSFHTRPN